MSNHLQLSFLKQLRFPSYTPPPDHLSSSTYDHSLRKRIVGSTVGNAEIDEGSMRWIVKPGPCPPPGASQVATASTSDLVPNLYLRKIRQS